MLGERRSAPRRALALMVGILVVAVTLVIAQVPQRANAALSGSSFDPGDIISDAQFFDKTAMTQAAIQTFLNTECGSGNCINNLSFATTNETANSYCPGAYAGATSETTAAILYKVEQACGISAKVLLVTLQKEQGLVTKSNPSTGALQAAMGYGCPDTAPCTASAYGFFRQVYDAAWQFQEYRVYAPHSTAKPIGWNNIQYSPNTSCGTARVDITNEATRGLYIYTPYVPNAAALANLNGVGNSCSSYGNRNFWVYYNTWFGSSTSTVPPSVTAVSRLGDGNRYATSVAISQAAFQPGVPVVYIADGSNYKDGVTAAAAAAKQGGPLLLVKKDSIPSEVLAEIKRLKPQKIVVAGSASTIDANVYTQLTALVSSSAQIVRLGGTDIYATSRAIAQYAFGPTVPKVFIATGTNVSDTIAASSAAGSEGVPIILIKGQASSLDSATTTLLHSFGTTHIVIVGASASISAALQTALSTLPGVTSTVRYAGTDPSSLSELINAGEFPGSVTSVYVVGTTADEDGFVGAAAAGAQHAPLYFVPATCVPSNILGNLDTMAPTKMSMVGSTVSVSAAVGKFVSC